MAIGLSKKFGFDEFVKFHLEWKKVDELQCFTIREIAAILKALSNKD